MAVRRRAGAWRARALAVVVLVTLAALGAACSSNQAARVTRPAPPTTTTAPAPKGGSGNTSPAAITTSADCPTDFSATLNKPSYPSAPPMTIDTSKTYTATITTDVGPFTVELNPKAAPLAVNSFVFLAQHHFFDCIIFHRVIQTF